MKYFYLLPKYMIYYRQSSKPKAIKSKINKNKINYCTTQYNKKKSVFAKNKKQALRKFSIDMKRKKQQFTIIKIKKVKRI